MVDWYHLLMNAFWIVGCASALATLSYASWEAATQAIKFWRHLSAPHIQIALNLSGGLFCVGLAGTTLTLWQRVIWILLGLGFFVQIGAEIYRKKAG